MNKNISSTGNQDDLEKRARSLIDRQRILTLATAAHDAAWAAPVYYVFTESCFYFFSSPESRHIQEALQSGGASAAISAEGVEWQEICGIQMSGSVMKITAENEALSAFRAYCGKFPFMQSFVRQRPLRLTAIIQKFRVRFYRFKPDCVYYLDNRIRFGFRQKVCL